MAVIMTRFCCCEGANLRLGAIVVGILSLIGSSFMLFMTVLSLMWLDDKGKDLDNPDASESFSNATKEHWEDTTDVEYLSLTVDLVSLIVAALLIYGTIKRILRLLYTYIVWTIVVVLSSLGTLIYLAVDGPRWIVAVYTFNFFVLFASAMYFILVVYSYSELIKEGGDRQGVPVQGPGSDAQGQWDIKLQYAHVPDDPGMGDDRQALTA